MFKHVTDLIQDDEACDKFMKQKAVAKFAGQDADDATVARGDIWFHARRNPERAGREPANTPLRCASSIQKTLKQTRSPRP